MCIYVVWHMNPLSNLFTKWHPIFHFSPSRFVLCHFCWCNLFVCLIQIIFSRIFAGELSIFWRWRSSTTQPLGLMWEVIYATGLGNICIVHNCNATTIGTFCGSWQQLVGPRNGWLKWNSVCKFSLCLDYNHLFKINRMICIYLTFQDTCRWNINSHSRSSIPTL